jgi:hypothetical protein
MPWPATSVEMRPLAELRPYDRNARQHPPEQIEQIAASMREFGFTIPVLVDETGLLIAGHGRVLAARKLVDAGRREFEQVPVMIAAGWTDAQRRAYTITDNRLTEASAWDLDLLRLELGELRSLDFNPDILGFPGFFPEDGRTDQGAEWQGMPEFQLEDQSGFHRVTVHFKDQAGIDEFARRLGMQISKANKYIWFPEPAEKLIAKDKRYRQNGIAK